jgi:tyrosyl-tRNA synthetase
MSKSLSNYIGINEPPQEIFGKVMSISDELMWRYWELCTNLSVPEIASLREGANVGECNPRDVKARLAKRIVADFYSEAEARKALDEFKRWQQVCGNCRSYWLSWGWCRQWRKLAG